jgi:hypothetical protein
MLSDCCALSLQPFRNPVAVIATDEPTRADVFDLLNIVPYVRKYKTSECGLLRLLAGFAPDCDGVRVIAAGS